MKLPWIPILVAGTLVALVLILFNSVSSGPKRFGVPKIEKLVDLDGALVGRARLDDAHFGGVLVSGFQQLINGLRVQREG